MAPITSPTTRSSSGGFSRADRRRHSRLLATFAAGLALVLIPAASQAAVFVVTTTADGNNGACTVSLCTLRDAVIAANANPGSSITLLSNSTPYTLTLTGVNEDNAATGDLDVTTSLTINGGGAPSTIIDGNATDRVFQLIGNVTLTLNDLTVRNGSTAASSNKLGGGISAGSGTVVLSFSAVSNNSTTSLGGGIFAANVTLTNSTVSGNTTSDQGGGIFANSVTMTNSTISGNQSTGEQGGGLFLINGSSTITNSTISGNSSLQSGAGIFLNGSTNANNPALLTITNSTISGNTVTGFGNVGGGLFLLSQATVTIVSSTIASNSSPSTGGNIQNVDASLTLKNTIVSNPVSGPNCSGTAITNGGGNLQFPGTTCGVTITTGDPLLQALAANGGPTQTRALGSGSPALNAASGCPPPATDQRGIGRPQGSACEIGAFECQTGECGAIAATATPTNTPVGVATATPTNTPGVTATPTRTFTPIAGVVVPTLTFPMLALLGLALAGAALLLLKR